VYKILAELKICLDMCMYIISLEPRGNNDCGSVLHACLCLLFGLLH
jgi:hypothetical protein